MHSQYSLQACSKRKIYFQESVTSLEMEPFLETFVKTRIAGTSVEKKINIFIGRANDSLQKLKDGPKFDLVFIDADKPGYLNYYKVICRPYACM